MKTREKRTNHVFHKMTLIILFPIFLILLSACAKQESEEVKGFPSSTAGSDFKDTQNVGSGMETEPDNLDPMDEKTVAEENREVLVACAGITITQTIESAAGRRISIDAQVDVEGVSRVSRYRYIPLEFTDEKRRALLKKMFHAEGWDVNEAAVYNEKENQWEIVTPRGESCVCQVRDSRILDEQIVNVERLGAALDYAAESEVTPIRFPDTPWEDVRLFVEFTDRKQIPSHVEQIGEMTIASVTEEEVYFCNYIHICGKDGEQPYIKAVFKQTVDGMPVTTWHDIGTAALKKGSTPVKLWGSFYSVEDIGLAEPILTPTEAITAMQGQIDSIQMQKMQVYVTKISLEYLAVVSSEGTPEIIPIWRFWPGSDELERTRMCEQIFAVNAVNGELIWEKRGAFTE